MKTPDALYTNEASSDYLLTFDKPSVTEQQFATFDEEALNCARERQAYYDAHPPVGIYRMATEGS